MTESLDDMPSLPVNTADLADKLANGYDSITCNTGLKDFITKTEVMYDISQLNFSYLTETEFNNKYISTIDNGLVSISVFHVNIRSLNSNHRKLCQFLQLLGIQFDVIVLSEIWRSNIDFYCNILPDYSFHYALPSRGTVGGVGIYVSNAFCCTKNISYSIDYTDTVRVENIWLNLQKTKKNLS